MKRSTTKSGMHRDPSQREAPPNAFRPKRSVSARVTVDEGPLPVSPDGAEELMQIRARIRDLLAGYADLSRQIDCAFGWQGFLAGLDPLDPANLHRFWGYFYLHRKVTKLLIQALELWTGSYDGKTCAR